MRVRVGQGWDIHRLVSGRPLRLGGIAVPSAQGLAGHSDGDVVLHALADALLGAAGAGDIGRHFPDTDPAWAGVESAALLGRVREIVRARGFDIGNVDVTVLAEAPRIAPFADAMRRRIASVLGIDVAAVSVKAKTAEGLGPIGERRAIGALAVVLLTEPPAGTDPDAPRSG